MAIFDPPQNRHLSTDHQKIGDYVGDPYGCAKLGAYPSTGDFWAHGWNITKIIFIYALFSGTHLQVRHVDGFSRMMAQTTRTRARMCLFWEFFTLLPIYWVKNPQNSQFWGVNRSFQAKLAKSKNVHIIKTTASIPTKFCTLIKTTKCPSWVVPTHALQIQDGGGRHLKKSKNRHISAAVQPILTKFGTLKHFDPLDRPDH